MTVGVGAGPYGRVAGSSLGVGIVVVAIREPSALFGEEAEAASLELGSIAVQVVTAELVDDHDDNQFGATRIRLGRRRGRQKGGEKENGEGSNNSAENTRQRLHRLSLTNGWLHFVLRAVIADLPGFICPQKTAGGPMEAAR